MATEVCTVSTDLRPKAFVLMTLVRPRPPSPFPSPSSSPWQGEPLGVWAHKLPSASFLRLRMLQLRDSMRAAGDVSAAIAIITPGTYKLVNGGPASNGEPLCDFGVLAGMEMKLGIQYERLYWVELADYHAGM